MGRGNLACLARSLPGTITPGGLGTNYVINLDPNTGDRNWAYEYTEPTGTMNLNSIVQPGPAADYQVIGNVNRMPLLTGSEGVLLRLDPATGEVRPGTRRFDAGVYLDLKRARYDPVSGATFVATLQGANSDIQPAVARLDAAGDLVFSRTLDLTVRDGFTDVAILNDRVITMAELNSVGQAQTRIYATDKDGNFLWAKSLPVLAGFTAHSLVTTNTGFAYQAIGAGARKYLVRFDPDGNLIYGKIYDDLFETDIYATRNFQARGNQLLIASNNTGAAGAFPTLLLLRDDGTLPDDCRMSTDVSPDISDVTVRNAAAQYGDLPFAVSREEFFWEPSNNEFTVVACRDTCPEDTGGPITVVPEICGNGIDDDNDGLTDCDDPNLLLTCCCLPPQTFELGPDSTLCAGVPVRLGVPGEYATYDWSTGEATDSITVFAPGTYTLTATDSCGNVATDNITLNPRPRPTDIDLGPDVMVCDNGVVPLAAPPGYATYRWVDGTTDRTFTAYEPGEYWVVATDSCGLTRSDTMRVTISPTTEINLGPDTTICIGSELRFFSCRVP